MQNSSPVHRPVIVRPRPCRLASVAFARGVTELGGTAQRERLGMAIGGAFLGLTGPGTALGKRNRCGRRIACAVVVGLVGLMAAACSSKSEPSASTHPSTPPRPRPTVTVTVASAGFSPAVVTTTVEGNIIWVQSDAKAHAITSGQPGKADGKFDSGPLAGGSSFTLVLHAPGTYSYFDKNLPNLTGQIVVNPHA